MPIIDDYNLQTDPENNDIITPEVVTIDKTNSKIKVLSDTFGLDKHQIILFEYNVQLFKVEFKVHVNGNRIKIFQKAKNSSPWVEFMDYSETGYRPTGVSYNDYENKHYKEGKIWKDYAINLITSTFKH